MELRKKPRIDTKVKVMVQGFDQNEETLTGNLSKSGVFLNTSIHIADIGKKVFLKIALVKDENYIRIRGKVVRITKPNLLGVPQGVAIEFIRPDAKQHIPFEKMIDRAFDAKGTGCRKTSRAASEVLIEIHSPSVVKKLLTLNVSKEGMFIKTPVDGFEIGDTIRLVIIHPSSNRKFSIEAQIVHLRSGESVFNKTFTTGVGVMFLYQNSEKKTDLTRYLKGILNFTKRKRGEKNT